MSTTSSIHYVCKTAMENLAPKFNPSENGTILPIPAFDKQIVLPVTLCPCIQMTSNDVPAIELLEFHISSVHVVEHYPFLETPNPLSLLRIFVISRNTLIRTPFIH